MEILIVEDQVDKRADIIGLVSNVLGENIFFHECQSLRSGLKKLVYGSKFDLILLDMSMPNFDPSPDDPVGGTPESFAGAEFMEQMALRNTLSPVVVITQYSSFEKGQVALDDLDLLFKTKFEEFYYGCVYYSSADDSWKKQLSDILEGIKCESKS